MEGVDRKWLRKSKIEFNVQQQEVKGTGHAFRVPSFSQFLAIDYLMLVFVVLW